MKKPLILIHLVGIAFLVSTCSSKSNIAEEPVDEPIQIPELDHSDTVIGPDTNKNGIRDDIDSLIEQFGNDMVTDNRIVLQKVVEPNVLFDFIKAPN